MSVVIRNVIQSGAPGLLRLNVKFNGISNLKRLDIKRHRKSCTEKEGELG